MNPTTQSSPPRCPWRHPLRALPSIPALALAALALAQPDAQAFQYFDTDGATAGFQAADGYTFTVADSVWNPNSSGIGTLAKITGGLGAQSFGYTASDLSGLHVTLDTYNAGGSNPSGFNGAGLAINSTSFTLTFTNSYTGGGSGNFYVMGSPWAIAAGSTVNVNATYNHNPGMNWGTAVTFQGGGTINFNTMLGFNCSLLQTDNGAVINLKAAGATTNGYTGGFTLTSGTLNFAAAASATAFQMFPSGKSFAINGGTVDNTSGSPVTLTVGAGGYSIGGNFIFPGSSSLNFGTAAVVLTGTRQITVNNNTLTIGGVISGSTYGITKAGGGTLALNNANTYTGGTVINQGTLQLTGGSLANTAISFTGTGTLAVQPGNTTTLSAGTTAAGTAGATLNLGGNTFDMTDGAISAFNLQQNASFAGTGLTIANGATLKFNLGNASADLLAVIKGSGGGTASVSGTVNVTVDTTGATLLTPGSYNLITAASGLTAGGPTWQFTGGGTTQSVSVNGSNYTLTLNTSDTAIQVTVASSKTTTATTLASSDNPSANAESVTFTATVTSGASGSVSFYDNNGVTLLGTGTLNGGSPNQTTYATSALTPGTHSITAVYGGDSSYAGSSSSILSQGVKPPAPTGLSVTPSASTQLSLSWTASAGATGYNVKRATTSGGPYSVVGTPTGTTFTDTGLTDGTTYYYVVSASNAAGESPNSTEAFATSQFPSPTGLVATGGNGQVSLSWTASTGATGYKVKSATTSGGPYTVVSTPSGTSYTDTGLSNGITVYYVVSATSGASESANSSQASATPVLSIAGNGTQSYLDTDGATARFQATTGSTYTLSGNNWNPSVTGIGTLAALPAGAQLTFGTAASDLSGLSVKVDCDTSNAFGGILINSTNVTVTLANIAAPWLGNNDPGRNWYVAAGSTLNVNAKFSGNPGMNWGYGTCSFQGGGTINFNTMLGFNDPGYTFTCAGAVMNLKASGQALYPYAGGFTLTSGTLNFAATAAADAFQGFASSGKPFAINGGTLDNTSGSPMALTVGAGGYSIGGSFIFTGSSDMDFGTAPVVLTATPQISVNNNTLTIGGVISGSGYGLTKAGPGTLVLDKAESYTGPTNVNNGTLLVSSPGSLVADSAVTVANGGTLGGSGTINGTVTVNAGGTIQPSLSGGVNTLNLSNSTSPGYPTGANYATLKIRGSGTSLDRVTYSAAAGHSIANLDLVIDAGSLSGPVPATTIYSVASGSITGPFHSVSLVNNTGVYLAAVNYNATSISVSLSPSGTITGAATATAFTTNYGTASDAQTFSVSGTGLAADLVATAPAGFEVSTNGVSYGNTATFAQSGGSAGGTLYVRLDAAAGVAGSYNSQNIVLTSGSATPVNITTAASGNGVTATALNVTAKPDSKTYGQTKTYGSGLNASTYVTVSGLQNTDAVGTITITDTDSGGTAAATAGGTYPLTPSALAFSTGSAANYTITYTVGLLTVTPATPTTTAPVTNYVNWSFNNGTGTNWTGTGNNLTMIPSSPAAVVASPTGWGPSAHCIYSTTGNVIWAYQGSATGLPTDNFVLSLYVKGSSPAYTSGSNSTVFQTHGGDSNGLQIIARASSGGGDEWVVKLRGGSELAVFPVTPSSAQHIQVHCVGGTLSVSLNGVAVGSTTTNTHVAWGEVLVGVTSGGSVFYSGYYGDITVSSVAPGLAATPITYGQPLSAATLSGTFFNAAEVVVPGTLAFASPSTVPNAGTNSQSVTFTPDDLVNYTTASASVSVVVNKATPTVAVTVGSYPYNAANPQAQGPTGYTTNPAGDTGAPTWSYAGTGGTTYGPSPNLPTAQGSYTATVALAADSNFNAASSSATAFSITSPTYQQWLAQNNVSDTPANFLAYAFGTAPGGGGGAISWGAGTVTPGQPTTLITTISNGQGFFAVFGRRANYAAARLTYTVQFSPNLDFSDGNRSDVVTGAGTTVLSSDGTIDAVSVPYPWLIQTTKGFEKPTFYRVMVNQTPSGNQTP